MSVVDQARAIADSVLYEGFLLYPYTGSALKNRLRWQFGVVMPHGYADRSEPTSMEVQMLAQTHEPDAAVEIVLRFLQVGEKPLEREVTMTAVLREGETAQEFHLDRLAGRIDLKISEDDGYLHLELQVENQGQADPYAERNQALQNAFVSAHVLMRISGGAFISLLDPPQAARSAASRCANRRVFPVLVGDCEEDEQTASIVLASPIILYDFPKIAPQSTGHTFDNTEIDELLLLSVAAMTDEEKREARATDVRAGAIVDRAEAMTAQVQQTLHGRGHIVEGTRVRVHPKRRADAFDMFAEGRTAVVCGLHDDVDGRKYVSVVFDDDPASDLHEWYGRSFFYEHDEVEVEE